MGKILEIDNLSKHFGGVKAINNFSLTLEEGRIYGLIGPNGAGKTTIFNVITGIYAPTKGSIKFRDKVITGMKSHEIAQVGIGRTFQNIRLFSNLTVLDNVMIACNQDITYSILDSFMRLPKFKKQEELLKKKSMMLLESFGLDHLASQRAKNLPYGHQRKLEIARALATEPYLLLLDEPAAGMNAEESIELVSFIKTIKTKYNITILMIEHHMDVVTNLCDECTVLNFGELICEGTPSEIKKNKLVLKAYLGEEQ